MASRFQPDQGLRNKENSSCRVVSSDAIGMLPIKLIAPITSWNESFASKLWLVKIEPNETNGLTQQSVVDTLQIRCVDFQERFIRKIGVLPSTIMEEISASIAIVVEYQ